MSQKEDIAVGDTVARKKKPNELGVVQWISLVKGRLRAFVRFDGYEQYNDNDTLTIIKKGTVTMATFDINIRDLDAHAAEKVISFVRTMKADEAASRVAAKTREPVETDEDEGDEEEAPRRGPPAPKVDQAAVKTAAAGKPAAKAAPTKPTTKAAPPPEEDDEEEDEPAPPKKSAAASSKTTNGVHKTGAKAAPVDDDEDEEEEEEASADDEDDDDDALPKKVLEARKLRDVLEYFMDEKSITDTDELKAACVKIKNKVPVLQRIADLESRIDRTLEVMDMGEAQS